MNIACCFIMSDGSIEKALLPEELVLQVAKHLREHGETRIDLADRSFMAEGLYIPAKGTNTSIMVLPDLDNVRT